MTIEQALTQCDRLRPNRFTQEEKLNWLSQVEGMVKQEIIDTHQPDAAPFAGYDLSTPEDTELLVPAPYDRLYCAYLVAQVDLNNAEYARYNNSAALFNAAYTDYAHATNRSRPTHKNTKIRV